MEKKGLQIRMFVMLLTSMLSLAFNVQPVESDWTWTGTIYIRADGSVDPSDVPILSADNITYTLTDNIAGGIPSSSSAVVVERDNIVVDGVGYTVQGTGNGTGIDLSYRSNVTIKNTQIKAFEFGIYLDFSSNNSIVGNNIKNNLHGILLSLNSNYNIISGNTIANNYHGLYLSSSSNYNSISENNITDNDEDGIGLYVCSGNSISGNNIKNNQYGIWLSESSNNKFCHNNFINNAKQVYDVSWDYPEYYVPSVNSWDDGYPSGGNYWSDYAGADVKSGSNQDQPGSDGIGDTPYTIDTNNRDRYPLMKPYPWAAHDVGLTSVTTSKTIVGQG